MEIDILFNTASKQQLFNSRKEAKLAVTSLSVTPDSFELMFYPKENTIDKLDLRLNMIELLLTTIDRKFIHNDKEINELLKTLDALGEKGDKILSRPGLYQPAGML